MKRYIGNKDKLVNTIDEFLMTNDINGGNFTDLYSGTGSVASYFRSKYKVSANDIMHYSFVTLKAKLSFSGAPKFKIFVDKYHMDPIDFLNALKPSKRGKNYIWKFFSPKGGRKYFTEDNALKIDAARIKIDKLKKADEISENEWYYLLACIITAANSKGNTSGTFGAYLKQFSSSALKPIIFKHLENNIGYKGNAYMGDGKEIVKKITADILYLDPPYTAIDYSQAYHLLESLSLYDGREVAGITGRRINNTKVSKYTKKTSALDEFDTTLKNAKTSKNVLLSYSTHGIIPLEKVKETLNKYYKEVIVKKIEYKKYRNVYSNDKGDLFELLVLGKGRK